MRQDKKVINSIKYNNTNIIIIYTNVYIHNYNAKDNTKSNWSTAYFHCGPC